MDVTDSITAADLDETDIEILRRVEANFDVSLSELSDELGLSNSAIHARLSKLKDNGVIRGVHADVDPLVFGLNMLIITNVSVVHEESYSENIGTELSEIDGVYHVYYTMGDIDFVVISRVQNRDEMNRLIDDIVSIDGVKETSSKFVMMEHKVSNETMANISDRELERAVDKR